ncbi:zinc finger protein 516-like [Festucalex cinctus]
MEAKARRQDVTVPKHSEMEEDAASGHTCGVCGRSFPLLSSLSQHMRRHTREKPYKCPYCDHRAAQKGTLKVHVRSHKLGLFGLTDQQVEPDTPEMAKRKPSKRKANDLEAERPDAGPFSCSICGQGFPQAPLLKLHMKRHRSAQDHGCRICGRRFRQVWFLQSHMRIHRVKAQLRGGEPPATINDVPQDPAVLANDECLYELCAKCGHFFADRKTLSIHDGVHKPCHSLLKDLEALQVTKKRFLESLGLTCVERKEDEVDINAGRRIPELDPVCSYQAWQLATRGCLAETTEKRLSWEDRPVDAEVAHDTAKGKYDSAKLEKTRKPIDVAASSAKKKKGDIGPEQGDKKSCHKERILLNGLGQAFYEALQHRTIKDKHTNRSPKQEDEKPLLCEQCDFHTADASSLRSHVRARHQDGKPSPVSDKVAYQSSSKASCYVDYLRKRSALLCQPYWNPYPGLPCELDIKTETLDGDVKTGDDVGSLLNLSAPAGNKRQDSVHNEGLPRHQCPYCSHATCYPEVLWIHQRVSHRVGKGSSAAPEWVLPANGIRCLKTSRRRRTGPPPFLEGKDCPMLTAPRSQRTKPPAGGSSAKQQAAKSQSGAKCKPPAKDAKSPDSRGRAKLEQKRSADGASKVSLPGRTATEGNFPKEGLGFMLSHGGFSDLDRRHTQRLPSPSLKGAGADLWASMGMWGHRDYSEPLLYAQAKSHDVVSDTTADLDVVSLMKSYSPHELAALYQHWGFVDPRLDPQAMLRLNGHFANEVHSSSEASKQVTSRSTSTSGSLHKGT